METVLWYIFKKKSIFFFGITIHKHFQLVSFLVLINIKGFFFCKIKFFLTYAKLQLFCLHQKYVVCRCITYILHQIFIFFRAVASKEHRTFLLQYPKDFELPNKLVMFIVLFTKWSCFFIQSPFFSKKPYTGYSVLKNNHLNWCF